MISPLGVVPTGTTYSKEVSLYETKQFVIEQILGPSQQPIVFEVDALSAANSGELTSLVYKCGEKQKEGMVLAFWGNQWNPAGVQYQAYGFKNFPKEKANELLNKIEAALSSSSKALQDSGNNVYFQYDDLTFLLYTSTGQNSIRVFWNSFDSEWNIGSFNRTKRRLEKKL